MIDINKIEQHILEDVAKVKNLFIKLLVGINILISKYLHWVHSKYELNPIVDCPCIWCIYEDIRTGHYDDFGDDEWSV